LIIGHIGLIGPIEIITKKNPAAAQPGFSLIANLFCYEHSAFCLQPLSFPASLSPFRIPTSEFFYPLPHALCTLPFAPSACLRQLDRTHLILGNAGDRIQCGICQAISGRHCVMKG